MHRILTKFYTSVIFMLTAFYILDMIEMKFIIRLYLTAFFIYNEMSEYNKKHKEKIAT